MKARLFIGIVAVALVWTGCSNDENGSGADARVPVEFTASVGVTETRAIDQTWSSGDAIGIFMVESDKSLQKANISEGAENIRYKVAAADKTGKFSPDETTIYFPMDNSKVDFYAYYPQGTVSYDSEKNSYLYAINVSEQGDETKSNQENLDLMYAEKVEGKRKTDKSISLDFKHQLCKVILTVEAGAGVSVPDMKLLTVTVKNQKTTAFFDLTTGALKNDAAAPADITLYRQNNAYVYEAILLPDDGTSRTFEFDLNNEHDAPFIWNMEKALVAGSKYTYTVNLNRMGVVATGDIVPWDNGNGGSDKNEVDAK